MDDVELLKKRFIELANRAYNSGVYTFTDFLGLAEQSAFSEIKKELRGIPYTAFGGAVGAERVMIRFGSEEVCSYEQPFPISVVKIEPSSQKFADKLTHRDFLGSILNLGIELLGITLVSSLQFLNSGLEAAGAHHALLALGHEGGHDQVDDQSKEKNSHTVVAGEFINLDQRPGKNSAN